jgi:hypothetical protein
VEVFEDAGLEWEQRRAYVCGRSLKIEKYLAEPKN